MSKTFPKLEIGPGVFAHPIDIPIHSGNLQTLSEALAIVSGEVESLDCYCAEYSDGRKCGRCWTESVRDRLREIVQPVHRSLNPDRAGSVAESVYLRRWQKMQARESWLNGGYGTLELLLTPSRLPQPPYLCQRPDYVPPVSQRDAEVAATVVQWLGTNGGRSFIFECEREIVQANAEREAVEMRRLMFMRLRANKRFGHQPDADGVLPMVENLGREVASHLVRADDSRYQEIVDRVAAAISTYADETERHLRAVVDAICAVIAESNGVEGLHHNGDVAPWEELLRGGRFEAWLSAVTDAAEFLGRLEKYAVPCGDGWEPAGGGAD